MYPTATLSKRTWLSAALMLLGICQFVEAQASNETAFRDRAPELQQRVRDLVHRLRTNYTSNPHELAEHYQQVRRAVAAWNSSERTNNDFESMAAWLQAAHDAAERGPETTLPALPNLSGNAAGPRQVQPGANEPLPSAQAPGDDPGKDRIAPSRERDVAAQHPAARPLPRRFGSANPFRDDLPPRSVQSGGPKNRVRRVAARPPTNDAPVNLGELEARMLGYHHGLRAIEAQLMIPGPIPVYRIAELVKELDDLVDQREFVALYLDTLSGDERSMLPRLRDSGPAVEMLAEKVIKQSHALRRQSGGADIDPDDLRRDLRLLQDANRQLTNLKGDAG